MEILLCHNYYQQPGGEDRVFAAESDLLRSRGHRVIHYTKHNRAIDEMGRWEAAGKTLWNKQVYRELRELIRDERPDILHATNIFPLISPSAYAAARDEGVPVVQSLHNYRPMCPNAVFFRNGRVCESCVGRRFAWPGVVHACYRNDRVATAAVATMLAYHRSRGTWTRLVDQYIALTEFSRRKFVEGGLPGDKISVKPNFVSIDPGPGQGRGGYAVCVGRLSGEKGVGTLLDGWARLRQQIPLKVVGDGPLATDVRTAAARNPVIQWLGRRPHDEVLDLVGEAKILVFPSNCYETFGLAIVESFAKGTPVIASRLGGRSELVTDGRTGLLFQSGDPGDLAAKVAMLWDDDQSLGYMRGEAREEFERKYTANENYRILMSVYGRVLGRTQRPAVTAADPIEAGEAPSCSGREGVMND